jgi:ketosteroid isomerase-like protein
MSEEKVELVRRALEALDRRDLTTWLAVHDEDFELVPTREFPEAGVRGPQAAWDFYLGTFAGSWTHETVEQVPAVDTEFVDAGADKVLLHYRFDLRGAGSGAEVEFDAWAVVTIRQGRIVRAQWFAVRDQAREAAGPSE